MRLLLDAMCGGIRAYVRVCGHDAEFVLDRGIEADDEIAALADAEDRTVVTRDHELADATAGIALESRDVTDQLRELADADVALEPTYEPERCGQCNGKLEAVLRSESTPAYAPDPDDEYVWRCGDCGQCFWTGSHWDRMCETLAEVRCSPKETESE